jgi:hypothetical protein
MLWRWRTAKLPQLTAYSPVDEGSRPCVEGTDGARGAIAHAATVSLIKLYDGGKP